MQISTIPSSVSPQDTRGFSLQQEGFFSSSPTGAHIPLLGIKIIIIYIALLVAYTILTYIYCSVKYRSAQKGVEEYYRELGQLKKIYDREEKRAGRLTGRRKGA